jgi:hypothetical protein
MQLLWEEGGEYSVDFKFQECREFKTFTCMPVEELAEVKM